MTVPLPAPRLALAVALAAVALALLPDLGTVRLGGLAVDGRFAALNLVLVVAAEFVAAGEALAAVSLTVPAPAEGVSAPKVSVVALPLKPRNSNVPPAVRVVALLLKMIAPV